MNKRQKKKRANLECLFSRADIRAAAKPRVMKDHNKMHFIDFYRKYGELWGPGFFKSSMEVYKSS